MRLDLIAKLIADGGYGTLGTDIFINRMTADCRRGLMIRLPLDGIPIDPDLPNYYKGDMQLIVRAETQAAGDALSANLQKLLTIYNRTLLNTDSSFAMKINHMIPRTLPRCYPTLEGDGIEWSTDFNVNYVLPPP
jgi:hypothetical protein